MAVEAGQRRVTGLPPMEKPGRVEDLALRHQRAPGKRTRGIVWVTLFILSGSLHLLGLGLFRPEFPPPPVPPREGMHIAWLEQEAWREDGLDPWLLVDSAPLFLPGPWNAPWHGEQWHLRGWTAEPYPLFPPLLATLEDILYLPEPVRSETLPLELFSEMGRDRPLGLFGYRGEGVALVEPRKGVVEWRNRWTGESGQAVLPDDAAEVPAGDPLRAPTAFSMLVGRAGEWGVLHLEESSGSDEWDQFRRAALKEFLQERRVWPQGYYFLRVGP